jgi:hypothetical protein
MRENRKRCNVRPDFADIGGHNVARLRRSRASGDNVRLSDSRSAKPISVPSAVCREAGWADERRLSFSSSRNPKDARDSVAHNAGSDLKIDQMNSNPICLPQAESPSVHGLAEGLFTLKELRLIAQGCRVSRLPWERAPFVQIPQRGYVILPFAMTQPFQGSRARSTASQGSREAGNPGLYGGTPSE